MELKKQKNVLGEDLEECSNNPLTGWFRDGCCNTDENDHGVHTVCAKVTTEFLEWLKEAGNDLITPHPEFGFPGLKDGDCWCVCATWFARSIEESTALAFATETLPGTMFSESATGRTGSAVLKTPAASSGAAISATGTLRPSAAAVLR